MAFKDTCKIRLRAFRIWRKTGAILAHSGQGAAQQQEGKLKDFTKGSFDSIPFLNADAKRTFVHLLLRPGYMIRDYLQGKHDIYMAPLAAMIIFYAFFSLVVSVACPDYGERDTSLLEKKLDKEWNDILKDNEGNTVPFLANTMNFCRDAYFLMTLYKHPEKVDTPWKGSVASIENNIRSQGINLFFMSFILMWLAFCVVLRKYGLGASASATTAAYIQCQFCFFMMFSLILSLGKNKGVLSLYIYSLLLLWDFKELFGISWKKSFWLTVRTGIWQLIWEIVAYLLALALILAIVAVKG